MKPLNFRNILIRDYDDGDYDEVVNLNIKQGDREELQRMCDMTPEAYFIWHLGYHGSNTKVILLNGYIIGILGISEGVIYFTTEEVSKGASVNFLRAFKIVIKHLMEDAGLKKVLTYVDAQYSSAVSWDKLCGFKMKSETYLNNNLFYCMEYKLP